MTKQATCRAIFLTLFVLLGAGSASLRAQVVASAVHSPLSLTAGGMVSEYNTDYSLQHIGGVGAYVDLTIFHGIGAEAEGRWQYINGFRGLSQDNYLLGPQFKLHSIWRARPYVKALFGFTNMNFPADIGSGRYTTIALGGGVDLKVTRRWSVRGDGEFQKWPEFQGTSLSPYGLSVGVGYRIF